MGTEAATNVTAPGIALDPSKRPEADRQQIKRLAQEFEAMLMTQMLREMRKSMLDDKEPASLVRPARSVRPVTLVALALSTHNVHFFSIR